VIRDSEFLVSGPFAQAALTSFFFMSSLNCFILLPLYIHRLGGTEAEIGMVQGAYSAIGILCQPAVGLWLDRVGRRAFMILGVVLLVVSSACFVFTQSLPVLALLRVLQGLGFSTFFVANYVHVVGLVPVARRGWALGIYGLSGFLGTALAPVAGEIVVNNLGFRWLFLLAVLLSSVAALLWRAHTASIRRTWAKAPASRCSAKGSRMCSGCTWPSPSLRARNGAMFTFMPTFGESLGVRSVALYYTAYAVAAMLVRVAGGNLIDVRGRRATIIPSMFIQASSVAILAILAFLVRPHMAVPIVPFLILAGLLAGGGHGSSIRRSRLCSWTSRPSGVAAGPWASSAASCSSARLWAPWSSDTSPTPSAMR